MRPLKQSEYAVLFPATETAEQIALHRVHCILQRFNNENNRLERLTSEGKLLTAQIDLDGQASAVFWYSINGPTFFVDTLVAIADGRNMPEFAERIERIARSMNCKVIECMTARNGMIDTLCKKDFYAAGVILRKDL